MRYLSKIFVLISVVAGSLTACIRDEIYTPSQVVEGMPTMMGVRFEVENDMEVTRAAQDLKYEHQVQNVYVFIFSNGNRVPLKDNNGKDISFYDSTPNNAYPDIQSWYNKQNDTDAASSGEILFEAVSGSDLQIVLVANIGTSNSVTNDTDSDNTQGGGIVGEQTDALGKYLALFNDYTKIATYRDLQDLTVKLQTKDIFRLGSFLMTGEKTGVTLHASEEGVLLDSNIITVPLYRADSKITFNVRAQSKASSNITNMQFIPGKWRVINIPTATYVIPRLLNYSSPITENMDGAGENFYSMSEQEANVFEGAILQSGTAVPNSATFTFYMYENLRAMKASATSYAMREEQDHEDKKAGTNYVPGQDYVNGAWSYAPDYGTYVELTGELSYTLNGEDFVLADVRYYIHLGHNSHNEFDSYATLRNHHYTYNVTINSVEDLIVEVDSNEEGVNTGDTEKRPGAEGDVVMSAQKVINVDGHYDRALITLTPLEAQEIYFANKTPWEQGLDTNGFLETGNTTIKDYKWVKFLINKEVGVADNQYAPYPGDQCYDGGRSECGTKAHSGAYKADVILRDIRQLSNYLKDATNRDNAKSSDGNIYITVFIDEYLYYYDPTVDPMVGIGAEDYTTKYKGIREATDEASLILWKKSVNQPDRMMHIVKAGDMNYSADGETSLSRSVVTIKQRAIQTFYNVSADDLKSAWGTELVNETARMQSTRRGNNAFPGVSSTTTYQNFNKLTDIVKGQKFAAHKNNNSTTLNTWADVISATEQYGLGANYNDATYACALRNRDLDGDGTMQENEIQWYLASLSQLSDMWVGEPAMPQYAKLYDPDNADGYYNDDEVSANVRATHYISTTLGNDPYANSISPMVYWAEQFGATSTLYATEEWGTPKQVINDHAGEATYGRSVVAVRCVRNLGMAYDDTAMPQNYFQVTGDIDGTESNIDLEFMNPVALRSSLDNGIALPAAYLDDVGTNNRSFFGFFVLPSYYGFVGDGSAEAATLQSTKEQTTYWYRVYQGENGIADGSGRLYTRVCPQGYRPPTQREMMIMIRALQKNWDWQESDYLYRYGYMMMNGQDLSSYGRNRFGTFYYFPSSGTTHRRVSLDGEKVLGGSTSIKYRGYSDNSNYNYGYRAVRCVKDNPNAKQAVAGGWGGNEDM